jgi:hypothetical protein
VNAEESQVPVIIVNDVGKPKVNLSHEIQFDNLEFSPDAESLQELQAELEADFEEFIACMKNSIFHGSGIQRLYNLELDMYRKKFLDLEEDKRRWSYLAFKYVRAKQSKIQIPAPKMENEIENRKKIAKTAKDLTTLLQRRLLKYLVHIIITLLS